MSTTKRTGSSNVVRHEPAAEESRGPWSEGDVLAIPKDDWRRLRNFDHTEPHRVLGAHPARVGGRSGVVVRVFHPDAVLVECTLLRADNVSGGVSRAGIEMTEIEKGGLFATFIAGALLPLRYRLRFHFADGNEWNRGDPYRFPPTLGEVDQHLFNEGKHRRLWKCMGAHVRNIDGEHGVAFAVWAPNARRVSILGDFCGWDGRLFPMRTMGNSGVFEIFIPDLMPGDLYKFEIKTQDGALRLKTDPFGREMEGSPNHAARVSHSMYAWDDEEWITRRPERDWIREPFLVYEVHLGSWARVQGGNYRTMNYREIAVRLVEHVKRFAFTHVELLPIAEHPLDRSWGYQVTGYYAPTHRYGSPDDFRYLVDHCHQNGIGVILDWVPGHFPKDDFALRRFDGTALYEHEDSRLGEHPDWGTLIFNFGRHEVQGFLMANALYWLKEFHVDGLRIDAVASMLYLDYSRHYGEWLANKYGGKENVDAIEFLRHVNDVIAEECPGCFTIAEESTAWSGVTKPTREGGLGFTFKWNMGWMHDTLCYFSRDPIHRKHHQDDITFAMLYEHTERFINAISHDEVVHGKRSLLEKMPGDLWRKFANLRLMLAYQFTRPGKKHLFMGVELAPYNEWNAEAELDWYLADDPMRVGLARFLCDLGRIYHEQPSLWRRDHDSDGFAWIDCNDRNNSVLVYRRHDGPQFLIAALNMTPVPRDHYRIGVPAAGRYVQVMCTDHAVYGGSGYPTNERVTSDAIPLHDLPQSLELTLPPLGALILAPEHVDG